jgi:hypothetical protein
MYARRCFLLLLLRGKDETSDIEDLGSVLRDSSIQTLRLPTKKSSRPWRDANPGPSTQEATMQPIAPPGPVGASSYFPTFSYGIPTPFSIASPEPLSICKCSGVFPIRIIRAFNRTSHALFCIFRPRFY